MTVGKTLADAQKRLEEAGIGTARLDALVLLEDVLNTNRTQVLAEPGRELTEVEQQKLSDLVAKRARHIPLAYIRGKTEFYGREFYVDERVLEPRPESETMIDVLKRVMSQESRTKKKSQPLTTVDIGTGSGALAITAKLELPETEVTATDIDPSCLTVARRNAKAHHAAITFTEGDLLAPLPPSSFPSSVLLCNLPYVPDDFLINTAATHEPKLAIFGGPDGLDLYRKLFEQIKSAANRPAYILTESLPPQHEALGRIAEAAGYQADREVDFIQLFSPAK